MNCRQWREIFSQWLEIRRKNDTQPAPDGLKDHADSCASCAARREAAAFLFEKGRGDTIPPRDLADRAMSRIFSASLERRKVNDRVGHKAVLRLVFIPLAAALAGILGTVAVLRGFGSPSSETVTVRFVLDAPEAGSVSLVGDWNGWEPEVQPLVDPDGDGIWATEVLLRRGEEYQYQFLIDETRWVPDPGAPLSVDDGFGGANSVLQI